MLFVKKELLHFEEEVIFMNKELQDAMRTWVQKRDV